TEAAKNQADAAMGILNSKQQTIVDTTRSKFETLSVTKDFQGTQESVNTIQTMANATDMTDQKSVMAAFVKLNVPGSSTLRGNAQVLLDNIGPTLQTKLLEAEHILDTNGTLSAQTMQDILVSADKIYNARQAEYEQNVMGQVSALNAQGVPATAAMIDTLDAPQTPQQMQMTAQNVISAWMGAGLGGQTDAGATQTHAQLLQTYGQGTNADGTKRTVIDGYNYGVAHGWF
ncbi:MAG TPA: hypothetical protein VNX68_15920, partial [Nitrosopumilaceae archaeon]|nr:hypothetical protein [Nitrosopumilaceae archaeon]